MPGGQALQHKEPEGSPAPLCRKSLAPQTRSVQSTFSAQQDRERREPVPSTLYTVYYSARKKAAPPRLPLARPHHTGAVLAAHTGATLVERPSRSPSSVLRM